MPLYWCGFCRRTYKTPTVSSDKIQECPTCRAALRTFDPESRPGGPTSIPPVAAEAARDPARRLGRFILVRDLGRGALGTVHQAWDTQLGRWSAVRLLKSG